VLVEGEVPEAVEVLVEVEVPEALEALGEVEVPEAVEALGEVEVPEAVEALGEVEVLEAVEALVEGEVIGEVVLAEVVLLVDWLASLLDNGSVGGSSFAGSAVFSLLVFRSAPASFALSLFMPGGNWFSSFSSSFFRRFVFFDFAFLLCGSLAAALLGDGLKSFWCSCHISSSEPSGFSCATANWPTIKFPAKDKQPAAITTDQRRLSEIILTLNPTFVRRVAKYHIANVNKRLAKKPCCHILI